MPLIGRLLARFHVARARTEDLEHKMKTDVWMPIYIGDYLADTIGLSLSQHGGYMLLIMAYWRNGGPLRDSDAKAIIRDASESDSERIASFFRLSCGRWHHKRIDQELSRATKNKESRSKAAKTASNARWHGIKTTSATHPSRIRHASPLSSPLPSPSDKAYSTKSATKLLGKTKEIADRMEACLNSEWINDAGKWVNRIKTEKDKSDRVVSEVESAIKENRIKTTAARYAEQIWKEFK